MYSVLLRKWYLKLVMDYLESGTSMNSSIKDEIVWKWIRYIYQSTYYAPCNPCSVDSIYYWLNSAALIIKYYGVHWAWCKKMTPRWVGYHENLTQLYDDQWTVYF